MQKQIDSLREEISCAVFDKYQQEAYSLGVCKTLYNREDIEEKKLLLDLIQYSITQDCKFCNVEHLKSLI